MKLLKPIIFLSFLFISAFTKAQDVILKKNGKEYQVNILKIDTAVIKFQKYEWRDNRIFTLPLKKLFGIKYHDGIVVAPDGSNMSLTKFEYHKLTVVNNKKLKVGIAMTAIGCTLFTAGGSLVGFGGFLSIRKWQDDLMWSPMAIVAGSVIAAGAIPLITIGSIKIKRANNGLRKAEELRATMSFNPVIAPNINSLGQVTNLRAGIGMALNF